MNRLLPLLLIIPLLLYVQRAKAQPYYFRHYQVENGLSNNTVNCSIQDKNGFLWFGTKEGLNRFDGYRFKLFSLDDETERTLASDHIYCLFIDPKNVMWVGAKKGLYRFDAEKERLVRFIDSLPEVHSIAMDKKGGLWFISFNTLYRYQLNTHTLTSFPPSQYFSATSVCSTPEGTIWCATTDGFIHKWNEALQTFNPYNVFSHSPKATSKWIEKVCPVGNTLYIGTSNQGMKQFDIATNTYKDLLMYNPDKTTIYVRDLVAYSPAEIWFATESGIFILNTATQKFINLKKKFLDPYSLSDNAVYSLCKDAEGGVWAGTYFGGLNYYPKQYASFQKYFPDNTANAISGNAVREICEDHHGNLWIGTEDAGLNKLNTQTGAITHFIPTGSPESIAYSNIHGLMVVGNDLWIGTFEHGLDVMDVRTGKVKRHYMAGPGKKDLKSNFIVTLLQAHNRVIYAGSGNGLFRYDSLTDGFDPVAEAPNNIFVSAMIEDAANTVWIGTHDRGIFYFNPITKQKGHFENEPDNKNSLTSNTINAICEDSRHNLWLATEGGGLCKLSPDRKKFTRYTTKNGLPSNFVFKVLEDNKNSLWVSTSKGLVHFDPDKETTTVYTKENGLLNDQFNYNSGYKDAAGKLYFGSVRGMVTFKPDDFLPNTFVPPVYITGFQIHNQELLIDDTPSFLKKSIIYTDKITLPYNQSSFSIDFAALSYTAPEAISYSYMMEGLDNEWTHVKPNRKVYFTNLSPGTYTFKVQAEHNGIRSKSEKAITIIILPPFWATPWAYLLYSLLGAALLYYLVRSYHIIIEDKKEKEIYEAKIDFFTNVAHEVRTPLTLIKGPVENLLEKIEEVPDIKEDVVMMERNTDRLVALITQILDFRQAETKGFSLDFTKVNITEQLQEAYVSFSPLAKKRNLLYTIDLPRNDVYALADAEALNKIFSNLFSNAVKYACKEVQVRLYPVEKNATAFTIEITNDGYTIPAEMREKIFEPFYRIKETNRQKGTGIGLALARSLAELHNGRLYLKNTQNSLNTFILILPLKPEQPENIRKRKIKKFLMRS